MTKWTAEVAVRRQGKSYFLPPQFVTVTAGTYVAAVGAAARAAKARLSGHGRMKVEAVSVKVQRVRTDIPE
jgi:hypothetical protein